MVKNTLNIPRYSYTQFAWQAGKGVAEASSLGIPAGAEPGDRVWADACDVGFVIRGEREDKVFTLVSSDVAGWEFISTDHKHQVTIFND